MTTNAVRAAARPHYLYPTDIDAAFECVSSDVVFHVMPGLPPTYEGWRQAHAMFVAAFPDMALQIEDEIVEGDQYIVRWSMQGTHRGDFMGLPATGRRVAVGGISTDRVADGRIVEHWANFDMMGLMQQLGATGE